MLNKMKNIVQNNNRKENKMITKEQIKLQMECFGYEVLIDEEKPNSVMCHKVGAPMLLINWEENFINFYAQYSINSIAKSNKPGFLSYVNRMNGSSTSASLFLTKDNENIAFANKYFGVFDRRTFANFVRFWDHDVIEVLNNDQETDVFLGSSNEIMHDNGQINAYA